MMNPDFVLRLTPLNSKNEENILELDPDKVVGWMGYPEGSMIIIDGPNGHSNFSVTEDLDDIRALMSVLWNKSST